VAFAFGYYFGSPSIGESVVQEWQNELCGDSKTHYAYIAKRGDSLRCFLENKEYPHRVMGANLD